MAAIGQMRTWRPTTRKKVGAAALLVACCAIAPLAIGIAGFLAVGLEAATLAAVAIAVVAVLRERRRAGCAGGSDARQAKARRQKGGSV